MALDYARVFDGLGLDYTVIGRGGESAAKFESQSRARVLRGGLEGRSSEPLPDAAIVAVGVESLAAVTTMAIERGIRRILVEKPAGVDEQEITQLAALAARRGAAVYVAYNRRFYAAVRTARRMIADDGGVSSFSFEFTEVADQIAKLPQAARVKQHWVLANSSHVLDLAFHLGGAPEEIHALHDGALPWHSSAAVFAGAGRTHAGATFAYHANWASAGRWGLEINTSRRRLTFRPMEELQVMMKGTFSLASVALEEGELDKRFKPGLYAQVDAFLSGRGSEHLCSIEEHLARVPTYAQIAGYSR